MVTRRPNISELPWEFELWTSDGLEDSRGAEKGVSCARFDAYFITHPSVYLTGGEGISPTSCLRPLPVPVPKRSTLRHSYASGAGRALRAAQVECVRRAACLRTNIV